LHAKNFAAEATATATVRFVVNPDWTTSVTVSTDLNWTSGPRVEIIGGVWVDIRSQVDGPAREALTAMAQNLQNAVPADLVSREVLKAWKVHRVPVSVAPAVYARLTPQNIGFSGLDIHDDAMHIGVMIEADTEVSTVDDAARSIGPLPPLARLAPAPGELSLRLPLRADYDVVKNALKAAFAGKTFQAETKAGKVTAKIEDVFIFPSNDRIVFGLKFDASLPGLIFDTAGTVFVSGKPVTENDGTLIRLTDVKFARQLDNDIWSLLSAVFEGDVKALIETKARVDLAPQIAKVVEDAKAAVADPSKTAGVKVTIRDTKAAIGDIALEEKSLAVMVKLDLGIDTQLQSLPLKAASAQ
ncbi:MAG: DUF4403 family protein, partial [Alphaproteobacteria bacterium]|nr:DUF4403 family protein [Alphaproteobacteria bacterium]